MSDNYGHMSDNSLNERQAAILQGMTFGRMYAAEDIARSFEVSPSPATLRRDMQVLEGLAFVERQGQRRGTRYGKTFLGAFMTPANAHAYFQKETDQREGLERYVHGIWDATVPHFFSQAEIDSLDAATKQYIDRSAAASEGVRAKELERFVIELSWKSSRIEGNTYTLLDTERLLREGIEAPGHTQEEARMILNHKKAFQYVLERKAQPVSNKRFIEDVHALLVEDLGVTRGFRKGAVGITGSSYRPLDVPSQLEEAIEALCKAASASADAYSRALLMLVGISYIQPFEDGNKRTARLIANASLLADGRAPLSYRSVDEVAYRESMLTFYEQLSFMPMKKVVAEQYRFACGQYLKA